MEQTCRVDEDGTYIVLMRSTQHPQAPPAAASLLHWFSPVRAEVWARALNPNAAPLSPRAAA